jgi:hypothetical protein
MANHKKNSQSFDSMIKNFLRQYNFATKQDINRLIQKIENLDKKIANAQIFTKSADISKTTARNGSASDMVIEVISSIGTGANFTDIQEKTEFDDKKLRNIIYRLNKQGKIRRKNRGVYLPL